MAEWGEPIVADVGSAGKDRSDEIVPQSSLSVCGQKSI